jgi:hypothetical protein
LDKIQFNPDASTNHTKAEITVKTEEKESFTGSVVSTKTEIFEVQIVVGDAEVLMTR